MKFLANDQGFQPESSWLPVPVESLHPIPDFVLQQIEKARLEDEAAAKAEAAGGSLGTVGGGGGVGGGGIVISQPSQTYRQP